MHIIMSHALHSNTRDPKKRGLFTPVAGTFFEVENVRKNCTKRVKNGPTVTP